MGIQIVAHRGDSGSAPENTLAAFRRAVELGADFVELDYHVSRDGVMVVIHDMMLDRTTDAAGHPNFGPGVRVCDRTWEELRQLDASAWPSGRWRDFPRTTILSLEEALDEVVVRGGCQCIVERKPGTARAGGLCELIRRMGIRDRVVITSGAGEADAWDFLDECGERLDGVRLAYQLSCDSYRDPVGLAKGRYVSCEQGLLSRPMVERLRERGLRVFAWTVNDPEDALRLGALGVEGIVTDHPACVSRALRHAR